MALADDKGGWVRARAMLLELMLVVYAFSLPLDVFRQHFPFWPARQAPRALPAPRRARLAEHDWERHVLVNLTRSE